MQNRPDVEEILKREKEWHREQIRRIDTALAVLRGDVTPQRELFEKNQPELFKKKDEKIPWKQEIKSIMKSHPGLKTTEVRDKLQKKGISKAGDPKYYNVIYSTLNRMVDDGYLIKNDNGEHFVKSDVELVSSNIAQ